MHVSGSPRTHSDTGICKAHTETVARFEPATRWDNANQCNIHVEMLFTFRQKQSQLARWRRWLTDHDGDVVAARQRQGAVHVQDVVLRAQEALQVLRVGGHLLRHGVHAACADQSLHEE